MQISSFKKNHTLLIRYVMLQLFRGYNTQLEIFNLANLIPACNFKT